MCGLVRACAGACAGVYRGQGFLQHGALCGGCAGVVRLFDLCRLSAFSLVRKKPCTSILHSLWPCAGVVRKIVSPCAVGVLACAACAADFY